MPARTVLNVAFALAAITVAVVAGSGCGSGQDPSIEVPPASTSSTSSTSAPPEGSAAEGTAPVSTPPAGPGYLTAVRVAGQGRTDRVVFEFSGDLPGYRIQYGRSPLEQEGSGDPIEVAGAAVLDVRLEIASGVRLTGDRAEPTYTGPHRVRGDTSIVTEAARVGDFEAVLTWGIGVSRQAPFRVSTLREPPRIVVDIGPA